MTSLGGLAVLVAVLVGELASERAWRALAPSGRPAASRRWCWRAAGALLVVAVCAPVANEALRSAWGEALQYGLVLFGAVPLAVLGAPAGLRWRSSRAETQRPVRRLPGHGWWSFGAFFLVMVGGRVPVVIGVLARYPSLVAAEVVVLVAGATPLWVDLVGSAPWSALEERPRRMLWAACGAWSTWIAAYVLGFSSHAWSPALARGASLASVVQGQEVAAVMLWFLAALSFLPVVFVNLTRWLGADDEPSGAVLAGAVTSERAMLGWQPLPPAPGEGAVPGPERAVR